MLPSESSLAAEEQIQIRAPQPPTLPVAPAVAGAVEPSTSAKEQQAPPRVQPKRKVSVFSLDGFPDLQKLDQTIPRVRSSVTSLDSGILEARCNALAAPIELQSVAMELDSESEDVVKIEEVGESKLIDISEQPQVTSVGQPAEAAAAATSEHQKQEVTGSDLRQSEQNGSTNGSNTSISDDTSALGSATTISSARDSGNNSSVDTNISENQPTNAPASSSSGGGGSTGRRSARSDTLGSTGSSRASSCDEPTSLVPPFESITETMKKNSQIPNAQEIKQHIDKLISQNEAIVENWNHISIRSYNSSREQNCSNTTTIASTSASTLTPSSSTLSPTPSSSNSTTTASSTGGGAAKRLSHGGAMGGASANESGKFMEVATSSVHLATAAATSGATLSLANNRPTKRWSTTALASPSSLIIPAHHQLPPSQSHQNNGSNGKQMSGQQQQQQQLLNQHHHNHLNTNHLAPANSSTSPYSSFNSLLGASLTQPTASLNHRLREVERKRSYNLAKHYPYIPSNNCFATSGLIDGSGTSSSGIASWQSNASDQIPEIQFNGGQPARLATLSPTKQRAYSAIYPLTLASQSVPGSPRTLAISSAAGVTSADNELNLHHHPQHSSHLHLEPPSSASQQQQQHHHHHHPQCHMAAAAGGSPTTPISSTSTTANFLQLQATLAAIQQQQQQQQLGHSSYTSEPHQLQLENAIQNLSLKRDSETQMPYQLQLVAAAAAAHQLGHQQQQQQQQQNSSQLAAAIEALRCNQQAQVYKHLPPQLLADLLLNGDQVNSLSPANFVHLNQNLMSLESRSGERSPLGHHAHLAPHQLSRHHHHHEHHLAHHQAAAGTGSVLADEQLLLAARLVEEQQRLMLANQSSAAAAASICQQNQLMEQQLVEHLRLRGHLAAANLELQQLQSIPAAQSAAVPASAAPLPLKKRKISEPNMRY